jgi:hypothetical protein
MAVSDAALPVPHPEVPGEEQVGEDVVDDPRDLADDRQSEQPAELGIARCPQPDCDCAVRADMELPVRVDRMQPAAHIVEIGAEPHQRIGLGIDVAEFDRAGPHRRDQPVALPVYAGVTDRTFRIVRRSGSAAFSILGCVSAAQESTPKALKILTEQRYLRARRT